MIKVHGKHYVKKYMANNRTSIIEGISQKHMNLFNCVFSTVHIFFSFHVFLSLLLFSLILTSLQRKKRTIFWKNEYQSGCFFYFTTYLPQSTKFLCLFSAPHFELTKNCRKPFQEFSKIRFELITKRFLFFIRSIHVFGNY